MHIGYFASEVFPFAKTGGLADVSAALPKALANFGEQVTIFMPRYRCVEVVEAGVVRLTEYALKKELSSLLSIIFIEHEGYFDRNGLYGNNSEDHPDNLERFNYFCVQCLELIKSQELKIDIVHCHDWQTALIPVYLKTKYSNDSVFAGTKSILTIHNLAFQGLFSNEEFDSLDSKSELVQGADFEYFDQISLLKAGVLASDLVSTVSPQYAQEILEEELGFGFDPIFASRSDKVYGILNGLDQDVWNPADDSYLDTPYTVDNVLEAKIKNKKGLLNSLGLEKNLDQLMVGFVGRLSHQKGIDLIIDCTQELVALDLKIIILGEGDSRICQSLVKLQKAYPHDIYFCDVFNEQLAHHIYAASDMFLMPSRFEPCGLSQLISLRYGTIPIVRKTGGLADSIEPFDSVSREGNGFVFEDFSSTALLSSVTNAVDVLNEQDVRLRVMTNAMNSDFSWEKSAHKYMELYKCLQSA